MLVWENFVTPVRDMSYPIDVLWIDEIITVY